MYYYAKIKEMMRESKEENEKPVIATLDIGTIFVQYFEQFDDYTFQYSWPIHGDEESVKSEVQKALAEYTDVVRKLDIVQIGQATVYNTNIEYFCRIVEECNKQRMVSQRDTKYVFFGQKVYRVLKYIGKYSSPFEHINHISHWNQPHMHDAIKDLKMENIKTGLNYYFCKEDNKTIFSLGEEGHNIVFTDKVVGNVPSLFYIDSIIGNKVGELKKG